MAIHLTAQKNQFAEQILSIFRDRIRVCDAQLDSFERLRHAPVQNPPVGPGQGGSTFLPDRLRTQILASFAAISLVRNQQRQICQNCIDLFDAELSKVQSPEEFANFKQRIHASLSQLETLEQGLIPLHQELKENSLHGRTVTHISDNSPL